MQGNREIGTLLRAAKARGLESIAITDHTFELAMTGLDAKRLAKQVNEIRKLDRKRKGIRSSLERRSIS